MGKQIGTLEICHITSSNFNFKKLGANWLNFFLTLATKKKNIITDKNTHMNYTLIRMTEWYNGRLLYRDNNNYNKIVIIVIIIIIIKPKWLPLNCMEQGRDYCPI